MAEDWSTYSAQIDGCCRRIEKAKREMAEARNPKTREAARMKIEEEEKLLNCFSGKGW